MQQRRKRHRKLLVATDFSDTGDRAVQAAAHFARQLDDASVTLFHVLPGDAPLYPEPQGEMLLQIREQLKKSRAEYFKEGEAVEVDADLHDSAVLGVAKAAADAKADLCIVGTHGRTGLKRMLIGSVAEGVVRHAPCDVLTISRAFDAASPMPTRIVVATDLSEQAAVALSAAAELMEAFDVPLHLLHVVQPDVPPLPTWNAHAEDSETVRGRQQAALEELVRSEYQADERMACHAVIATEPAAAIADYAAEVGADLVVVGTHGRTGVGRLLIGSIAERTVRHAKCAVLVVRGACR